MKHNPNQMDLLADSEQLEMDLKHETSKKDTPVTCLGIAFPNDNDRRKYFIDLLREKLKDQEFRKIEGFPIGKDEDILALSDPPYYTACPNPWIGDFVKEWESSKPKKAEGYVYSREPYAADVSEGKNDPIYNAHSYHTKVPHKAIMRYILHYTEPGDIVFDGFCGTGMTGVAAQMCGDRNAILSLGYQVKDDGAILREEADDQGKTNWVAFSKLGIRRAILNDLSPAATFISYNYNMPVDPNAFVKESKRVLAEVEKQCGWMYETMHTDGKKGKINYTVWSDVFICQECAGEVVFWDQAVDAENGKVHEVFPCLHCSAKLSKRNLDRAWTSKFDAAIGTTVKQAKQVPVQINYSVPGISGRFEKLPDAFDLQLIARIESEDIEYWYPSFRMIDGRETKRNDPIGLTHVHHFYTKRNLRTLATLRSILSTSVMESQLLCLVGDQLPRASKMHKIAISRLNTNLSKTAGVLAGTLYVPSNQIEYCLISMINYRIKDVSSYQEKRDKITKQVIFTSSSERIPAKNDSIDYFFFDPPFGANLNYSELNSLWEAWLKVLTNNKSEAIENSSQGKDLDMYRHLMSSCFKEAYRILKPGHWFTIEFSNTSAAVWNSIQTALTEVGFIVANVSVLDKKQGSFKAVTTPTAVKQDLVISAYKPNGGFEERFVNESQTEDGVWDFIRTHLKYLPVIKKQGVSLQKVPERDPRILFDQMIAYYVRKGYSVPIDSQEFQSGLAQRFSERDYMYFLPEQAAEYDRKKANSGFDYGIQQEMFVNDEASAIEWLRNLLKTKPQTFQDINPEFMQKINGWKKTEKGLELSTLLHENFICYDGKELVPEQIHAYLSTNWKDMRNLPKDDPTLVAKAMDRWYVPDPNKAGDIEKLREKALLREFDEYKESKKKLKIFRLEAVRAGFKKAWQDHDYATIISVAEKVPNDVLEEDPKLLMWYDQAITRKGDQ